MRLYFLSFIDHAVIDVITRELFKTHKNGDRDSTGTSVQFRLHYLVDTSDPDDGVIKRANESLQSMRNSGSLIRVSRGILFGVHTSASVAATASDFWSLLFQNVTVLVKLADTLSDVGLNAQIISMRTLI
jgi:hypothetical protein